MNADILNEPPPFSEEVQLGSALQLTARTIERRCDEFKVSGKVEYICPGPVVTTFEYALQPGIKMGKLTGIADDLSMALATESIRIDRVPGRTTVAVEVPNLKRKNVYLRELFETPEWQNSPPLAVALGKKVDGAPFVFDLAKAPHMLIAGTTGSGKSVGLNAMLVSLLWRNRPEDLQLVLIDPKQLEMAPYADIPHLALPVVTDVDGAIAALDWAVDEMTRRYGLLAAAAVRDLDSYNVRSNEKLPRIVIVIDELADLMMTSGFEVEASITRLAQMARAVGMHLIVATQRPSVDVVTGLIKANFPTRVSFRVSAKVDSMTILDTAGAEKLLGRGDMLLLTPTAMRLTRIHGANVDDGEVKRVAVSTRL